MVGLGVATLPPTSTRSVFPAPSHRNLKTALSRTSQGTRVHCPPAPHGVGDAHARADRWACMQARMHEPQVCVCNCHTHTHIHTRGERKALEHTARPAKTPQGFCAGGSTRVHALFEPPTHSHARAHSLSLALTTEVPPSAGSGSKCGSGWLWERRLSVASPSVCANLWRTPAPHSL